MTCLFRAVFRFPCPTCGVTRAMIRLVALDWQGYVHYNAMALPLCIATVLILVAEKCRIRVAETVGLVVLFCNIPYYAYRLLNGAIS